MSQLTSLRLQNDIVRRKEISPPALQFTGVGILLTGIILDVVVASVIIAPVPSHSSQEQMWLKGQAKS